MQFRIDCPCGEHVTVSEGAAGLVLDCACGRKLTVPSSTDLRALGGAPGAGIDPEFAIQILLGAGKLRLGDTCSYCGENTDKLIFVLAECERAVVRTKVVQTTLAFLALLVLSTIFLPIRIFYLPSAQEEVFGQDRIYTLPLPLCEKCREAVGDSATVKRCLCRVPEYRALLEKYPKAKVAITDPTA